MELLHFTARTSVEWMLYCLLEGSLLALFACVLLRLLPRQNAGTRFALWFSVLLATILLPFLAGAFFRNGSGNFQYGTRNHSLLTLSDSVAMGIFSAWSLLAALGLVRLVAGLWQVNRIRRNSEVVDPERLDPALKSSLENFPRSVILCCSDQVHVPAAIGFLKPTVVIPRWFLEEMPAAEIRQVVLHELTHLRRRDDWTNLAQKVIKAVLFFHPSVWWVEQRLSLEREMACDDAVLAQSTTPQRYAECLARLAERSLAKKKISLAQAVVGRMRQLSLRVAQILDVNRPSSTRIWKPAVPLVMTAAALCGFSAWSAPQLVSFQDEAVSRSQSVPATGNEIPATLRSDIARPKLFLASASVDRTTPQSPVASKGTKPSRRLATLATNGGKDRNPRSRYPQQNTSYQMVAMSRDDAVQPKGNYVLHSEQLVMTVSDSGQARMWRVSTWQLSIVMPAVDQTGKTVSRKKI